MARQVDYRYNIICFTAGRGKLECRLFANDKPVGRFKDNDIYVAFKRKIDCNQTNLGLNCEVR